MLSRLVAAAAAALAIAAAPATAQALPTDLTLGFSGADSVLSSSDATTNALWTARAHAVGTQITRLDVTWAAVAPAVRPSGFVAANPSSPGYDWDTVDTQVRDLTAEGFKILLSISVAPVWAEGPHIPKSAGLGSWRPNPAALGAFATAIARRYSGGFPDPLHQGKKLPRVGDWQVWNEPNLGVYLAPQWTKTSAGWQPESALIYRSLENVFYAAVTGVNKSNYVVAAGTAPYGDPPGGQRMPPVTFDEAMFCLSSELKRLSCPDPVHLDAIDHHPYGIYGPTWHALDPGDVAVADIYKLTKVLDAAELAGTVLPGGPKQVWVTEVSWNTDPPNPGGVPLMKAADWLEQTFYVLWSQGVSTIMWYQLVDGPPAANYLDAYQAGVYLLNGTAKPGAVAFRFPFLTNRLNPAEVEAWGRAPASGKLVIEMLTQGQWRVVDRLTVHADDVFEAPIALTGKGSLRAQLAGETSLVWQQGA